MKFTLFSELAQPRSTLAELSSDLLAIAVYKEIFKESENFKLIDAKLDGLVGRIAEEERFQGKPQQTLLFHTHGKIAAPRLLLVGLGTKGETSVADLRHAAAKAARAARSVGAKSLAFVLPAGRTDARAIELAVEGILLGRYRFDRYLTSDDAKRP